MKTEIWDNHKRLSALIIDRLAVRIHSECANEKCDGGSPNVGPTEFLGSRWGWEGPGAGPVHYGCFRMSVINRGREDGTKIADHPVFAGITQISAAPGLF